MADLFGQAMNGEREDGFPKGRECALKYAAGVRTRGERRYAIFERTVKNIPVEYFLAMERKTVGCPSLAFVLLLRGTLWNQKMPLWGVFPQGCGRLARPSHERRTGCGASRYGKNASGVFHEPCGIRKYPGGVFSRKAVADLFGQAMNGERKIRRLPAALETRVLLKPGPNPGFQ